MTCPASTTAHWHRRDKSVSTSYQHWGQYTEGAIIQQEPNEYENCAGGNFTQSYGKAAGWADTNCDSEYIYICRFPGALWSSAAA
jgi:hypothetical protein